MYTLLYNKLFISLMWFVRIISCYYIIIFLEGDPNQVMLRVIIYLMCLSLSRVVKVKNALLCKEKKVSEFIHNLSLVPFRRKLKSHKLICVVSFCKSLILTPRNSLLIIKVKSELQIIFNTKLDTSKPC